MSHYTSPNFILPKIVPLMIRHWTSKTYELLKSLKILTKTKTEAIVIYH